MRKIKTITSHAGLARFLAETSEEPVAYLARVQVEDIPSPYAYSPSKPVWQFGDKLIVWFETKHRHYEVYEVPPQLLTFKTDDAATEWNTRFSRK